MSMKQIYFLLFFRFGRARREGERGGEEEEEVVDKAVPDFTVSGKLAAETNTYKV